MVPNSSARTRRRAACTLAVSALSRRSCSRYPRTAFRMRSGLTIGYGLLKRAGVEGLVVIHILSDDVVAAPIV